MNNNNFDCPNCGAWSQTGIFCEYCKSRLRPDKPKNHGNLLYRDGKPIMWEDGTPYTEDGQAE